MPGALLVILLPCLVLLGLAVAGPLQATTPVEGVVPIHDLTRLVLRDPARFWVADRDLAITELPLDAFRPLTGDDVNQGITGETFWVRVRLSNAQGMAPQRWVLYHETSYLDELVVYHADDGAPFSERQLTDRAPFHQRQVDYRTLAFEHTTPAGAYTDLYLRLSYQKPDSMSLNLQLSRADLFYNASRQEYLVYGGFYGMMLSLLLIATVFALLLRQRVFLVYGLFLAASLVMWAMLNGLGFQYLWPQAVYWHNEGFHIVFLLVSITALHFSRLFLKTANFFPGIDRLMRGLQWLFAAGIVLRLAGPYEPVLYLSFASLLLLALLPLLGYAAWRRGLRYARWYAAAWVFYGLGLLVSVLSAGSSLLHWGMAPLAFAQAGSVLEAVFLLVALGERLQGWDRDRLQALAVANQDPLTRLGNRRALQEAFARLQQDRRDSDLPLVLILMDLDHFKEINDEHGHEAGDQVLVGLAQLMRRTCRPQDVCVRYGGEEFAILLQVPGAQEALEIAERIRRDFAASPTPYKGHRLRHTLTAGLSRPVMPDAGLSQEAMLQQADDALYRAKRAGRNRSLLAE
ncbi:MAG: sensor domain-containing diguanylate cyclase [Gammaproteobacteria bacterium]|nr:sensor domain-containing diguanylate cyclase [Gammaproteobacteria bacterium]MDX5375748.1 sensor domain-containing diguanylate cyclase [Gammaproteobacteria bacterium]